MTTHKNIRFSKKFLQCVFLMYKMLLDVAIRREKKGSAQNLKNCVRIQITNSTMEHLVLSIIILLPIRSPDSFSRKQPKFGKQLHQYKYARCLFPYGVYGVPSITTRTNKQTTPISGLLCCMICTHQLPVLPLL